MDSTTHCRKNASVFDVSHMCGFTLSVRGCRDRAQLGCSAGAPGHRNLQHNMLRMLATCPVCNPSSMRSPGSTAAAAAARTAGSQQQQGAARGWRVERREAKEHWARLYMCTAGIHQLHHQDIHSLEPGMKAALAAPHSPGWACDECA